MNFLMIVMLVVMIQKNIQLIELKNIIFLFFQMELRKMAYMDIVIK